MSNRHEGDLRRRLLPFEDVRPIRVALVVDPGTADAPAVQHTVWMLANLLARAYGIIASVSVSAPAVQVRDLVVPFGASVTLQDRIIEAANNIGVVQFDSDLSVPADRTVNIGTTGETPDLRAVGAGWWGGVTRRDDPPWQTANLTSTVPFGPYAAACFAAAELFLDARHLEGAHTNRADTYGWDLWGEIATSQPSVEPTLGHVDLAHVAVAGIGAVGASWAHAMWAYEDASGSAILADADAEGVSETNLNRGVLFTRDDIGKPKAGVVAHYTSSTRLRWDPRQGRFQDVVTVAERPNLLVSAVDTNSARDALQQRYPARIVGGSTRDLRAELYVSGQPGFGACLRCFNPPEAAIPDEVLRSAAIDDDDAIAELAHTQGISADAVQQRLRSGACDVVSDRLMQQLRERAEIENAQPQFSVGFASVMAGTMLAAETIKSLSGPRPKAASERSTIQFWKPASAVDGRRLALREEQCPRCEPDSAAVQVWSQRFEDSDANEGAA